MIIKNQVITYAPCEIEKLYCANAKKDKVRYSMRDFLAKKNANQIWGNDFIFESEDESLVDKFNQFALKNRLLPLFKYIERELSLHGRVIVCLNKGKDGEIKVNVANPFFYSAIGKVFVTEELAVLWQRVILDTGTFYIKSTYDKEKCTNELFDEKAQMVVYDAVAEIKGMGIEKVWYHNLGFVPVVEITNYPIFQFQNIMFNPEIYFQITDWYNSKFLEDTLYLLWKDLNKEVVYCHSRIAIENANQKLIDQITNRAKELEDGDGLGDYIIETEVGGKAQAIPGAGDFTKYTTAMNDVMDFYFKFANSSRFSDGNGAQKTSAEANQSNNQQLETFQAKIKHREYEYTMLIAKILAAMGLGEFEPEKGNNFIFRIVGNTTQNDNAFVDMVLKEVQSGTMSLVEAIAKLRGISLKQAETIFENIKQFNKENDVMVSTMMGDLEREQMSLDADKGGRPTQEE